MSWAIVWTVLGFVFLIAAGFTITRVGAAQLGEFASRFIAVVLAILGYYGLTSVSDFAPQLTLNPVNIEILRYAVPIAGAAALLYYGWKVYENRKAEIDSVMKSGIRFLLVVVFAALARFFLSL
jgi:hypothetical protein